uniref:Uncharacterized protein n=1 Tax=Trichuris muris TaxID=70415 RepID=A0A5S6Q151_TRIMR
MKGPRILPPTAPTASAPLSKERGRPFARFAARKGTPRRRVHPGYPRRLDVQRAPTDSIRSWRRPLADCDHNSWPGWRGSAGFLRTYSRRSLRANWPSPTVHQAPLAKWPNAYSRKEGPKGAKRPSNRKI